jgi:hypothetical protein
MGNPRLSALGESAGATIYSASDNWMGFGRRLRMISV